MSLLIAGGVALFMKLKGIRDSLAKHDELVDLIEEELTGRDWLVKKKFLYEFKGVQYEGDLFASKELGGRYYQISMEVKVSKKAVYRAFKQVDRQGEAMLETGVKQFRIVSYYLKGGTVFYSRPLVFSK